MASRKAVADARARIRELQAQVKAAADHRKAAELALAPAAKKLAALEARQKKMLILTGAEGAPYSDGGGIRLTNLRTLTLNWGANAPAQPKKLADELLSGGQKINAIGSTPYTLRGWLRRGRAVTLPQLADVRRTTKARERAQAALKRAWQAEREAYQAAFDAGEKLDEKATAALLAQRLAIRPKLQLDHEIIQAGDDATRNLPYAEQHLAHLLSSSDEACPCPSCAADRQEAIRQRESEAKLDDLPTVMEGCPYHNGVRHRVSISTRKAKLTNDLRKVFVEKKPEIEPLLPPVDRQYGYERDPEFEAPIGICRKQSGREGARSLAFWRVSVWYTQLVAAAKVAAKEAKVAEREQRKAARERAARAKQPIVITPTVNADGSTPTGELDFICPSCHEQVPFEVQRGEENDDEEVWVECPMCGYEGDPDVVKTVAKAA